VTLGVFYLSRKGDIQLPKLFGEQNREFKKFESFEKFYPFYLSEHSYGPNRLLHIIATFGVIAYLLYKPLRVVAFSFALFFGILVCETTLGFPSGIPEFAIMGLSWIVMNYLTEKRIAWEFAFAYVLPW
jgi:hypothetical protein